MSERPKGTACWLCASLPHNSRTPQRIRSTSPNELARFEIDTSQSNRLEIEVFGLVTASAVLAGEHRSMEILRLVIGGESQSEANGPCGSCPSRGVAVARRKSNGLPNGVELFDGAEIGGRTLILKPNAWAA